jgi:hypothetical protein
MEQQEQRTEEGRFKPGRSGNPAGKPKGARNKAVQALERLGEAEAEAIVTALIEKAKGGDAMAAKPILDRVWPPRRGARLTFELPSINGPADLATAIGAVTRQVADGEISPDEGALIVGLLEAQRKAVETVDLAARIDALEQRLSKS